MLWLLYNQDETTAGYPLFVRLYDANHFLTETPKNFSGQLRMFFAREKWLMHTLCGGWIKLCLGCAIEASQSEPARTSAS
jgi:hypothetical protein